MREPKLARGALRKNPYGLCVHGEHLARGVLCALGGIGEGRRVSQVVPAGSPRLLDIIGSTSIRRSRRERQSTEGSTPFLRLGYVHEPRFGIACRRRPVLGVRLQQDLNEAPYGLHPVARQRNLAHRECDTADQDQRASLTRTNTRYTPPSTAN